MKAFEQVKGSGVNTFDRNQSIKIVLLKSASSRAESGRVSPYVHLVNGDGSTNGRRPSWTAA